MTVGIDGDGDGHCKPARAVEYQATLFAAFFAALSLVVIYLSRDLIGLIGGDSLSYINFSPIRPALYPAFIDALDDTALGLALVTRAQSLLYLATLFLFVRRLRLRFRSPFVTFAFGLAVSCNAYLQAFHTALYTESLVFSCVNLMAWSLLNMTDRRIEDCRRHIIVFGLAVGLLIGLRQAMWSLVPAAVVVVALVCWWRGRRPSILAAIACLGAPIAAATALEAALYHGRHAERESSLRLMLFGKTAMLTTEEGFAMPPLPPARRDALRRLDEIMQPFEDYLGDETASSLLRSRLRYGFKHFSTRHALPRLAAAGAYPTEAEQKEIGWAVVAENPWPYLRLSSRYYLDLWLVGAVDYAMTYHGARLPRFPAAALNQAVPDEAAARRFHRYLLPVFAVFGAVCLALSIYSWGGVAAAVVFRRLRETPAATVLAASLFLLAQSNLLFVVFTAHSQTRYLMPMFPMLVLGCLSALNAALDFYRRRLAQTR